MIVDPGPDRYRFQSVWRLPADPDRVFAALADANRYPTWWPQVRSTRQLDESSGEVRCRSLLPYDIVFVVRRVVEDPVRRVLTASLDGDLDGTTTWTIVADGAGTRATFDEDVIARKGLIRNVGRLVRPAVRLNHQLMMRAGEAGLRRFLSARSGDLSGPGDLRD